MKTADKKLSETVVNGLEKAIHEIEEVRLQIALGKAEAKDAYEDIKRSFQDYLQNIKLKLIKAKDSDTGVQITNALEHLQVQLILGMAESKELFEAQYKKIHTAIQALELSLKQDKEIQEEYIQLRFELEKFKIKLELMALHFQLNKIKVEYNFETKKKEFLENLTKLKNRINTKGEETKEKWDHFQDELSEAYEHLKKAFSHD